MRGVGHRRREAIYLTHVLPCAREGRSDLVPSPFLFTSRLYIETSQCPCPRNPDRHIGLFAYPVLPSAGNRSTY